MKAHVELLLKHDPSPLGVKTKNMLVAFAVQPLTAIACVTSAWICESERQFPGVAESVHPEAGSAPVSIHTAAKLDLFLMCCVRPPTIW